MERTENLYDFENEALDAGFSRLLEEIIAKKGPESEIGKALSAALELAIAEQKIHKAIRPPQAHKSLRTILTESIFGGSYQEGYELESVAMLAMIRSYAESALQGDLLGLSVQIEKAAVEQTGIDALTQIYNRRKVNQILSEWLSYPLGTERRERKQPVPFAVIIFDLDHFKQINDKHGHLAGDEVLVAFAQFLKANLRTDSGDDIVARWGGEEFMVLMRADEQQVAAKLQSLLEKLRTITIMIENRQVELRSSVGWTMFEPDRVNPNGLFEHDQSVDGLTHQADVALYAAKHNGRDRVQKYQS